MRNSGRLCGRSETIRQRFAAAFAVVRLPWIVPIIVVLLAAPAAFAASNLPEVRGIRFGVHGSRTRIVIDITHKVDFKARLLSHPPRAVVDLSEVRWRVARDPLGRPRGLARGHRFGLLEPGRSRLIVDLRSAARIAARFTIPPGEEHPYWRYVLDLEPAPETAAGARPVAEAATPAPRQRSARLVPPPRPKPAPAGKAPPSVVRRPVVVLDPGHGGIDPGTIGVGGVREKDLTLAFARVLREELARGGRYEVHLTREDDRFIPLRERIAIARAHRADLFISLHADSIDDPGVRGASVYTLSEKASDAEAERLARKENKVDILAGVDLSDQDAVVAEILIDLARRDTNNKSIRFAENLIRSLSPVRRLLRRNRRFAGFAVLKAPDTPSVLLELGYLSNRADAARLVDAAYQRRLARAIREAVDRYFDTLRPPL